MLELIGYNQKRNPSFFAAWLESENSLNEDYIIKTFGIDPDRFFFINYDKEKGAEGVLDDLNALADNGIFDIIVINSLKCLVPKSEIDGSLADNPVALQARMNSKMIKKFTSMIQEHDTAFVAITHKTVDIAIRHGDNLSISGGRAIAYASMLTLDYNKLSIQEADPIKREEGMKIKVTCRKNHCTCDRYPYGAIEYFIRYGEGIAWELELLQAAIDKGVLVQKGAWISEIDSETGEVAIDALGNAYKWNGKNAFRIFIIENHDYHERLEMLVDGSFEIGKLSEAELKTIESDEIEAANAVKAMSNDELFIDPIAASRKATKKK